MKVVESQPTPRTPRWGLGDAAVGFVPAVISAIALLGADPSDPDPELTLTGILVGQLFVWVFLAGVPLLASARKGNGPVVDFGLSGQWRDAPRGIAIGIGAQAILVPLLYLPILRLLDDVEGDDVADAARDLIDSTSGVGLVVLFLVIVVAAPIIEELFFRGLLLRSLERRVGTGWAVAGSSVLFGLSHVQGIQLPALIMFGVIAGLLTVRSGRLGPAIFAHIGFNGWTFAILAGGG